MSCFVGGCDVVGVSVSVASLLLLLALVFLLSLLLFLLLVVLIFLSGWSRVKGVSCAPCNMVLRRYSVWSDLVGESSPAVIIAVFSMSLCGFCFCLCQ